MISVSISINGEPIICRSAVNTSFREDDPQRYEIDDGRILYHNRKDGAVDLAIRMLDGVVETSSEKCTTCGFNVKTQRSPVVLNNNPLSIANYIENTCPECGHQKDGSTLPASETGDTAHGHNACTREAVGRTAPRAGNSPSRNRNKLIELAKSFNNWTSYDLKHGCVICMKKVTHALVNETDKRFPLKELFVCTDCNQLIFAGEPEKK